MRSKQKFSTKAFLDFYTRFPIPWWLFLLTIVLGLVNTEVVLAIANYTIRFNKGELYNSVIIGYSLLTVLNALISMLINVLNSYGTLKITLRARGTLWRKILHLPLREVERRQPSALISGVVNDVTEASNVIQVLFAMVTSVYGFFRCCMEMARFNARLSAYVLLLLPLAFGVFALTGRLQYLMMLRRYESLNTMTEFFSEHISATKYMKAQAIEDQEMAEGLRAIDERYKADIFYALILTAQTFANSLYTTIGSIVIAVFGSGMIRKGEMPETGINDFSTYKVRVDQYMAEGLTYYQTFRGTQGALQYVGVLLNGPEEVPDSGLDLPPCGGQKDLVLERVSFGYSPDMPILHDLSLRIPGGKMTAIIGNNGSGKSTLLKLLQGIYPPDSGRILLGDTAIEQVKLRDLRRQFGYILQHNPLLSGTVEENITYGVEGEVSRDAVIQAAQVADADGFIRTLPQGYDSQVGDNGSQLSGGQRQRVAIARTVMAQPDYLLMDEAGASLDHSSDVRIQSNIRRYMKGRTVIVVAHDMNTVKEADYIVVLNHGALEAAGTHEQLLQSSPTYRDYLEKQGQAVAEKEGAV